MTATLHHGGVSGDVVGDPRLAQLLLARQEAAAAVERRAVEAIREWMLVQDRSWLAVNFTRTRPEAPFAGDEGLAVAVRNLPRAAFGSGLDLRGSFIVRLEALNAILGLAHCDRSPLPTNVPWSGIDALVIPGAVWAAFLEQEAQLDAERPGDVTLSAVVAEIRRLMSRWGKDTNSAA